MKFSDIVKRENKRPADAPPSAASLRFVPKEDGAADMGTTSAQAAHKIYSSGITAMREILAQVQVSPMEAYSRLRKIVEEFLNLLTRDNQALLVLSARSSAENYLYAHSVNTAILSLWTGLGLHSRYRKELSEQSRQQMILLGVAAMLHDIGMSKWTALTREPRKLTVQEMEEIRLHTLESTKLLNNILDLQEAIKPLLAELIGQTDERITAKRSPKAGEAQTHPGPQIISLCGVYEAMTHYRAWREPALPNKVIQFLMKKHRQKFDPQVFKAFVQQLSFYPPGSFVRLSNGEVGCVTYVHVHSPASPTVEIWVQRGGRRQEPLYTLDLSQNRQIWIESALDETQLQTDDKDLLQHLRQRRWLTELKES